MEKLTVLKLLRKYRNWVKNSRVQFLKGKEDDVLPLIDDLINDFQQAYDKVQEKAAEDLSDALDWFVTHMHGRKLWQKLISHALYSIDPDSKGNSKLTDFLEKATDFEELLYGLEDFYRDHTLHSLWVYLIGEYLLREPLSKIYRNLNWYLLNDITDMQERKKYRYPADLVRKAINNEKVVLKDVNKVKDAIWCIIALCHDLGYSLAKLNQLNEKVKNLLEFFNLPEFNRVGYALDLEHQYRITQFLELMSTDVRIVPHDNYRDEKVKVNEKVLIKCFRDDSTYWRVCQALEEKQHGILSSYLIYRTLGIFGDSWMRGPAEKWGLDDEEAIDNIIRGDILFAIAQHEFDYAHLYQLSSLADILILADELEEFSRYGRHLRTRKYHDTTAHSSIRFQPEKPMQGNDINIEVTYNVAQDHDMYFFFQRKAKKLCKKYSLGSNNANTLYCTIKSIKMNVKQNDKKYYFYLGRQEIKGYLPKTKKDSGTKKGYEHQLICHDDEIFVLHENEEIALKDWLSKSNLTEENE